MPPKKASAASKKEAKKPNVEFERRKEEMLDEAEERAERMREWIATRKQTMLQQMLEAIETLDPALLNMTVGEMLQMPVAGGEETNENDELRTAREMTVDNGARPNAIQETAVRPQKPGRVLELRTPAGNAFKCPSFITPRVGAGSLAARPIRADEVAFSAAGSPIVLGAADRESRAGSAEFDRLHELVNADEMALSPTSRELVQNIKGIMQRKMLGDPV